MSSSEFEFYKSIGFELMAELAGIQGQSDKLVLGGGQGVYQTLFMNNGMVVRFTRWRDGSMPFYIVLFDKTGRYGFELDLSMIVHSNEFFTWHLKVPSNKQNIQFLFEWLGDVSALDIKYCEEVKGVKQTLKSGINTPKNGYSFVDHSDWSGLCDKFVALFKRAIAAHTTVNDIAPSIKEAENDDDPSYGKKKLRRNPPASE